jgi:putative FmdB family regulatory protein
MPLYDFRCDGDCGYFEDMFIPLAEKDAAVCPDCGGSITTRIGAVVTVGPMPSKPLRVKQVGREFTSNSEYKQYQRANPDCAIISAGSSEWQKHRDSAREKAERMAKKRGYRDLAQQHERRRVEKAKEKGLVDKKVFV